LAALANAGDKRALSLWLEFHGATKGRPVVTYSPDLSSAWKAREEAVEPRDDERVPVALVASDVWNRAWARRGQSLADVGLRLGRREGVEAMAEFWSRQLAIPVVVGEAEGLPFVHFATSYEGASP
jgi:hypothetical protein